eukprot:gb/GEZN01000980.1/.p1 GENE.gb/GEZN01000980.1/~~gb/GEZN01000980.1/.p1  ORF type:complete len:1055 (+),score=150.75 gb/GEZN01000980.1/:110-3274(+)
MPFKIADKLKFYAEALIPLCLPMLALFTVCGVIVYSNVQVKNFAMSSQQDILVLRAGANLVHALQQERGLSTMYLTAGFPAAQATARAYRQNFTAGVIRKREWTDEGVLGLEKVAQSPSEVLDCLPRPEYLSQFRSNVLSRLMAEEESFALYTSIIECLNSATMINLLSLPAIMPMMMLTEAKEQAGRARAKGGAAAMYPGFASDTLRLAFHRLTVTWDESLLLYRSVEHNFELILLGEIMLEPNTIQVYTQRQIILSGNATAISLSVPPSDWWDQLSIYIERLNDLLGEHLTHMEAASSQTAMSAQNTLILVIFTMVLVCAFSTIAALHIVRKQIAMRENQATHFEEKTLFLAKLSGGMRNPLHSITTNSQLAMSYLPTINCPELQEFLRLISTASTSMLTLTNDILDFCKAGVHQLTLEKKAFDIRFLVNQIMDMLYSTLKPGEAIELQAFFTPEVPMFWVGDSTRLQQVLLNLVGNSLKFTSQGSVELHVETLCVARQAFRRAREHNLPLVELVATKRNSRSVDLLLIRVKDTGCGMGESILTELSEPDQSSRILSKGIGQGLGLTISRQLVWAMGGEILISSERGRGTLVSLYIPEPQRRKESLSVVTQAGPAERSDDNRSDSVDLANESVERQVSLMTGNVALSQLSQYLKAKPAFLDGTQALFLKHPSWEVTSSAIKRYLEFWGVDVKFGDCDPTAFNILIQSRRDMLPLDFVFFAEESVIQVESDLSFPQLSKLVTLSNAGYSLVYTLVQANLIDVHTQCFVLPRIGTYAKGPLNALGPAQFHWLSRPVHQFTLFAALTGSHTMALNMRCRVSRSQSGRSSSHNDANLLVAQMMSLPDAKHDLFVNVNYHSVPDGMIPFSSQHPLGDPTIPYSPDFHTRSMSTTRSPSRSATPPIQHSTSPNLPLLTSNNTAAAAKTYNDLKLKKVRVLLVEDKTDPENTLFLMLKKVGCSDLLTAADSKEAIRIVERESASECPIELLLTDYKNGLEATKIIRNLVGKKITIVCTSFVTETQSLEGMNAVLQQPFKLRDIYYLISCVRDNVPMRHL